MATAIDDSRRFVLKQQSYSVQFRVVMYATVKDISFASPMKKSTPLNLKLNLCMTIKSANGEHIIHSNYTKLPVTYLVPVTQ